LPGDIFYKAKDTDAISADPEITAQPEILVEPQADSEKQQTKSEALTKTNGVSQPVTTWKRQTTHQNQTDSTTTPNPQVQSNSTDGKIKTVGDSPVIAKELYSIR
jgi:hypothetical protein